MLRVAPCYRLATIVNKCVVTKNRVGPIDFYTFVTIVCVTVSL